MKVKVSSFKIFFVGFLILVAIRIFSFVLIPDRFFDYLEIGTLILLIGLQFFLNKNKSANKANFSLLVKLVILFTLFSSIPAYIFHHQSFSLSLLASRTVFFWILYFLLHKLDVNVNKLELLLVYLGLIWAFIMIIQQISFPHVWFSQINDFNPDAVTNSASHRGGLNRIFVQGTALGYFLFFIIWRKFVKDLSVTNTMLFLVALVSLFLSGSRQIIFGLLFVIFMDFILTVKLSSKKGIQLFVSIFIFIILISPFIANYMSALILLSQSQQVTSSDYIRILEINYFLFQYWPHWFCYFAGNGWEHPLSSYGVEIIEYVKETLKFYRSDIGLIGAFNKFGLFYILVVFFLYYKVIFYKRIFVPHHIKLFFIFCLLTSFTGGNYFEMTETIIPFACAFYIIDKHNVKNLNFNTNT